MCLAIYKPADANVPVEHLKNGFANHPDGAGFAWAVDGKLFVRKGIFDVDEVVKQYELVKQYPCLIHFRKATHGKIDEANCHPFLFNDGKLALIHNGVLSIKCNIEGLSDTAHFVKLVLEPMVKRNKVPINDGALHYLITTSIGTDKIAIMDGTGTTYVYNEDKGKWEGGVWYSNTSFSWVYKTQTTNCGSAGCSTYSTYFNRNTTGGSTTPAYDSYKSNWRKKFETDSEDDESYLEFWKRTLTQDVPDATELGTQYVLKQSQKLPMLSRQTVDDAGNVDIIDVEEVEDVEEPNKKEKTYGPGQMCDYGWWDEQIESDIETLMKERGCTRDDAIIRVFNK